jgi:predicted ATPase
MDELAGVVSPAALLRFDPRRLIEPARGVVQWPHVEEDGRGLVGVLQGMALKSPDDFRELQEAVRRIIPGVRRIRFEPDRLGASDSKEAEVGNHLVVDWEDVGGIRGHLLSDGTILVIGLMTVLMGPTSPHLVLMDDLERALHPKAAARLVTQIRSIQKERRDLQVIATTHSPYLLDCFRPEEVRLSALNEHGHAVFGKLIDHPEFERWKDEMMPGEFWSSVGEDWLTKPADRNDG